MKPPVPALPAWVKVTWTGRGPAVPPIEGRAISVPLGSRELRPHPSRLVSARVVPATSTEADHPHGPRARALIEVRCPEGWLMGFISAISSGRCGNHTSKREQTRDPASSRARRLPNQRRRQPTKQNSLRSQAQPVAKRESQVDTPAVVVPPKSRPRGRLSQ